MSVIDRVNRNIQEAIEKVKFDIVYKPGMTEDFDRYQAQSMEFQINYYGTSPQRAVRGAKISLYAFFSQNYSEALRVLGK